jgi:hypothetical protein
MAMVLALWGVPILSAKGVKGALAMEEEKSSNSPATYPAPNHERGHGTDQRPAAAEHVCELTKHGLKRRPDHSHTNSLIRPSSPRSEGKKALSYMAKK